MRNRKNVIMMIMIVAVMLMATGYAYFSTKLNINATGNITSTWNVYFESINSGIAVGGATNASTPSVSGTSANMNVNLNLPGDSMTYSLVLKNGGTVPAIIEDIDAKAEGSTGIIYSISGLNIGDKLSDGASKTITIKIEYDPNTSSQPVETYKKLTVTIDAVQDIGQSITSQTPSIEGEIGTLARAILNNNQVQSDEYIDFNKASTYISSYKEVHAESTASVSMSSSNTYYYGSGYTFNESTGQYTLTGTTTGKWSTMSTKYEQYPYTCKYNNTDSCITLYKMTGYTSTTAGIGYKYIRENVYSENGKGLFYTSTNTIDNKPTYYFRGDITNNYVSFGTYKEAYSYENYVTGETESVQAGDPIIWRIVRINEDGSIRIITESAVGSSAFNSNYEGNGYVGYMYGTIGSNTYLGEHANTNDSTIKDYLDDWYTKHLSTYSNLFAKNAGFCNDRSIATSANTWESDDTALGYGTNITYYGAYSRFISDWNAKEEDTAPQFKCPNETDDLFTLTTSSKGNKSLTNPIGMLTMDEVIYAGGRAYTSNENYYLVNGEYWWTVSSLNFGGGYASVWYVDDVGSVFDDYVDNEYGVRPAINLSSNVEILDNGADGTVNKPYVIKTN